MDSLSGKLGAKIRKAETDKIPHMLILGKREVEEGKVSVRSRADPSIDGSCTLDEFTEKITAEIESKALPASRDESAQKS